MIVDAGLTSRLASIALSHVRREYPNRLDHVLTGPQDVATPRSLHPIFYGSFDWHSCVHSFWMLASIYRVNSEIAELQAIRNLFDNAFTPAKVAGECAYLARPGAANFERPYGWAWLLMLQAELLRGRADWGAALKPLADAIVTKFRDWLPRATYPVRSGTHGNTAFALRLATEYASVAQEHEFAGLLRSTAMRWYGSDADCRCGEPGGEDFLSPALVEAQCMGTVMEAAPFRDWIHAFLPRLKEREPNELFRPAHVSDRSDGRIVHLDGLNLSRAWSWREIAARLDPADPVRPIARSAAEQHLATALPHISGDYMGEHWLATYVLLAVSAARDPA